MSFEIRPAAAVDFDEASDWYRSVDPDLRDRFVASIDRSIQAIARSPVSFAVVEGTRIRRAVVSEFPYSVYFFVDLDHVVILAVFHNSRNPIIWRSRAD